MLIVGSSGHGGFADLLLGSAGTACAARATCRVLLIHGDTPAPV
jgi:nucleotide-binding universal stress UspA family protein